MNMEHHVVVNVAKKKRTDTNLKDHSKSRRKTKMDFKDVKEVRVTLTQNDDTLVTFHAFEMAKEVLENCENVDEMKSRIFNELVEQLQESRFVQVDVYEATPGNPNNIIGLCRLIRCDTVKEIKVRFIGYGEERKNDN